MNDTIIAPDSAVMKEYQLAIDTAMSAIWQKEIVFQTTAPAYHYQYTFLSSNPWPEGVSYGGYSVAPSSPVIEDDVRAREIESRLNALGSDGRAIAKSLQRDGITGMIGSPSRCAIAQWLQKNFESYGAVSVGPNSISLLGTDGAHLQIVTSPAVRDFIRMFDAGVFPNLIDAGYARLQQALVNVMITKEEPTHAAVSSPLPEFVPCL